ncbi:MAG: COX15/CtaA family protein [Acidobacteria bacterium]|nr:COX15/CtaA family protein [Acidobacteriota bacterium]
MSRDRAIAWWLLTIALMVLGMVAFGGLVRLTGSGLSITEWRPVTGTLPPLSSRAWEIEFGKYKASPQYQLENSHYSMAQFQFIYWMEYGHRLLGRSILLVLLLPLMYFKRQGWLDRKIWRWTVTLLALGALQGFVGWYMVKSGLVDVPQVSHFRLTAHLLMALATFSYALWHAIGLFWPPRTDLEATFKPLFRPVLIFSSALLIQIVLGGFLAGLKGGHLFSTFPLMAGKWGHPAVWVESPWWMNFLENPAMINFLHRSLAMLLTLSGFVMGLVFWARLGCVRLRRAMIVLLCVLALQVTLGILTLIHYVPTSLASLHQVNAFLLWAVCLFLLQQARIHSPHEAMLPGALTPSEAP